MGRLDRIDRKLGFLILVVLLACAGCRKAGAALPKELLYVDAIEAPAESRVGDDVVVTIHGNRPDPSWVWDRNDVSQDGATVTIDVVGRKTTGNPVAMVLIPFTTTATLSGLPTGAMTLVIRGRQRAHSQAIFVKK